MVHARSLLHRQLVRLLVVIWVLVTPGRQVSDAADTRRGLELVTVRDKSGQSVGLYSASYALVIGVSAYTGGWPKLPGVKDDVRAVREALEAQGFQVVTSLDPTRAQLEEAFAKFISAYGGNPEHRLLFYFAGHGHTIRPQYGGNPLGYLVPTDAPNPHNDPNGFKRLALSMQRIEEYALTIDAKHAMFLFDSCFSGSLFALSRAIPEHISYKTAQPVRQFITSGDENEQVPDESIFRQQFVAALQGEGDVNGDGYVTGTELGEFLQTRVVNYSKEAQHPQYGKIRHPQLDKGDFVFLVTASTTIAGTTPSPSATAEAPPTAALEAERQRLAEERRQFEALQQRAETPPAPPTPPPVTMAQTAIPFFMTRLVTAQDLRGKSPWELDVMRNEIYARHGRRFKRDDLQRYFDRQPWYQGRHPPDDFPATLLTAIQLKNVQFIQQYQQQRR